MAPLCSFTIAQGSDCRFSRFILYQTWGGAWGSCVRVGARGTRHCSADGEISFVVFCLFKLILRRVRRRIPDSRAAHRSRANAPLGRIATKQSGLLQSVSYRRV